MKALKVRIKKLYPNAVIPKYAHDDDAGMDVFAHSKSVDEYGNITYGLGFAIEIPYGYVGMVYCRSSIYKYPLLLTNNVGVIDANYRGELSMKFNKIGEGSEYEIGNRIGQLVILPYPKVEFEEVEELSETERGAQGYGSTGN